MTRDELFSLLTAEFELDPAELDDDTPLFTSGRLDSFRLVDLMAALEARCRFRMAPEDVDLDNLDSIAAILRYLRGRVGA